MMKKIKLTHAVGAIVLLTFIVWAALLSQGMDLWEYFESIREGSSIYLDYFFLGVFSAGIVFAFARLIVGIHNSFKG